MWAEMGRRLKYDGVADLMLTGLQRRSQPIIMPIIAFLLEGGFKVDHYSSIIFLIISTIIQNFSPKLQ